MNIVMDEAFGEVCLTKPQICLMDEYNNMMDEWESIGERIIPWVLRLDRTNFPKLVENLQSLEHGVYLLKEVAPNSTFWLLRKDGKMLGASNIRFSLSDEMSGGGGHIGYGIRPSERCKGYAAALLRLSLGLLKSYGVKKAIITCDYDNYASERVIVKNGGVFDYEFIHDGIRTKKYWINLL